MNLKLLNKLISKLENKGISFDSGLTEIEVTRIETMFNFLFLEDLKEFLKIKLPISKGFVNWRYALNSKQEEKELRLRLNWPLDGLLSSIREGNYWNDKWGDKPQTFEDQKRLVENAFKNYPKLIPIYSHRYIPSTPLEEGNPVFSAHQMDTIYYGLDLTHYFQNEFNFYLSKKYGDVLSPKRIKFWSELVDQNI